MHPSDNVNQRQNINNNQPNNNGTSQNVVNNLHRPNPSLMRINIDDQDKQKICIFWTILIVFILLIAILSAFAIPKVFIPNDMAKSLQSTNLKNCINPNQVINSTVFCDTNNTRAFGQLLTRWNQYNQFITVYLQIKPNNLIINQQYTFQLYEASIGATDKMIKVDDKEVLNAIISFDSDSALKLYAEDDKTVVGYIHLYVIITRLSGKALYIKTNFSTTANFNNIKLKMQSYAVNQKFTGFTITLRYIFFFTSIITAFLYIKRYLIIPQQKKIIQQKFIFIASILLIMFNDPFYIITILKPNGVRYFLQYKSAFFSIMVIMNLIAFLLLFWIVVLKRIHLQDGVVDSQPVTKGPIAYAIVVWTLLVIVNMTYAMQQIDKHPIISNNFSRQYQAALIFVGLVIFLGVFWIVVYYIKIFLETESKLWRSNIFMSLSIFVIIILFVLIVTNSLSIYNYKGSSILFVYCLVNMYIYYLQFMFSITLQQIQKIENPQLQDQINFIQMASVGTINIVDVNLSDYNPQDKRQYNLQQKQNEIYFKNPNLIQPPKLHQLEEQNQEVQTQNIAKQNDKDQIDSFGFD